MRKLRNMRKSIFSLLLLLLIPVSVLIFRANANKTYWQASYDPSYSYLLNGLNLAYEHGNVGLYQHPGATVHLLSAAIINLTYKFRTVDTNLRDDVLLNPELYLKYISWVILLLSCGVILLNGYLVYRFSNNIIHGLLFQLVSIYSLNTVMGYYSLGPDPILLMSGSSLIVLFMAIYIYNVKLGQLQLNYELNKTKTVVTLSISTLAAGILMAFCLATKLNTLPLMVLPLIMFDRTDKLKYLFVLGFSFILFTLPISNHYKDFIVWGKGLLINSGNYGTGKSTFIDLSKVLDNIKSIIVHEYILITILLITAAYLLNSAFRKKMGAQEKFLMAVLLVEFLIVLMVVKHFELRYLMPIYPLTAINLILLTEKLAVNNKTKKIAVIATTFIIILFKVGLYPVQEQMALNKPEKEDVIKIYSEGCSSKEYALRFGDFTASNANADALEKLYGKGDYFYIVWNYQVYDWKGKVDLSNIFKQEKTVYFYAAERFIKNYKDLPFNLKELEEGKYLLTPLQNEQ